MTYIFRSLCDILLHGKKNTNLKSNAMKKFIFFIGMLGVFSILSVNVSAQATANHSIDMGIPEILLLSTKVDPMNLVLTTGTAGAAIAGGLDSSYVQVSSIRTDAGTHKITASIANVPAGTTVQVNTEIPTNANQGGALGTGTSNIVLGTTAVDLVTAVGSCYTGTGFSDGYKLVYAWLVDLANYANIRSIAGGNALVTLTIAAE